jgi:hypothetical protein
MADLGRFKGQVPADRVEEHQARLARFALQQRRQLAGEGGLAAAGRADQQVTAQGGRGHRSILGAGAPMACGLLRTTNPNLC